MNTWSHETELVRVIHLFVQEWNKDQGRGAGAGGDSVSHADPQQSWQRAKVNQTLQSGHINQPSSPAILELTTGT